MQSGISASQALQSAFQRLTTTPSERGLLATIENETLVPVSTIPASSTFHADLAALAPHLKHDAALYILLRLDSNANTSTTPSTTSSFAAITYIPDHAPVRQKTLFASTRLTLVRELGSDHFSESIFATTKEELSEDGWRKHEMHVEGEKPLTQEERDLEGIKEAEAREGAGTGARRVQTSGFLGMRVGEGVEESLEGLKGEGDGGRLVQLKIDVPSETVHLVSSETATASDLATAISSTEPRYSFYRHDSPDAPILFIYTCPAGSKVKERMVYAASRGFALNLAEKEVGLTIAKRMEASTPDEITEQSINEEFAPKQEVKTGFAKPKRPGRR
ncbi:actin monomer binding protein-like protein [Saccharata proteae CBS 121410]|uniref:Twinfilin n=1 Tax=Saccharata proteae CBS 121410 TaxID=1314787 RepID=A0A9P4HSQ8_9PEZI|nr:actin monomer binding protein-like protein [Saccharata proteae CBS 121410]